MGEINRMLKDIEKVGDFSNSFEVVSPEKSMSSISSRASASTYFFPVLVSNTIDPKVCAKIVKNLEYAYGDFLKACFALQPAINADIKNNEFLNVEEYLNHFHQNIGIKSKDDLFMAIRVNENTEYVMFPNDILNEASADTKTDAKVEQFQNRLSDIRRYDNKDIKEYNAFAATPVTVPISFIFSKKLINKEITVGVKTMIHQTTSQDLVTQISNTIRNRGILHNFVRYTSGELNSLTDILLNAKSMKSGVAGKTIASRWFSAIDHRRRLNKLSMGLLAKRPYLPNVSIVITMDEVNEIARQTGNDLFKNNSIASKFITDNLLLGLTIYDPSLEIVHNLFEGYSEYDNIPLVALKRNLEREELGVAQILKAFSDY